MGVLITGGTGFVGSRTTAAVLAAGHAVIHAGSTYAYALPFWRCQGLRQTTVHGTAVVLQTARTMGLDPIDHSRTRPLSGVEARDRRSKGEPAPLGTAPV